MRGSTDLLDVLGLREQIRTLEVPRREPVVRDVTYNLITRFLVLAARVNSMTDGAQLLHGRHIAGAFLIDRELVNYLTGLKVPVAQLRKAVVDLLVERNHADRERWETALEVVRQTNFSIETIVSRDTWTTDDNLGYHVYAHAITVSILDGTAEPPLTIGIQAPWGQGKTSLMRMIGRARSGRVTARSGGEAAD